MINLKFEALCKESPDKNKDILVINDIKVKGDSTFFFRSGEHDGLQFMKDAEKQYGMHLTGVCCWSYFDFSEHKSMMKRFSEELPDTSGGRCALVIYADDNDIAIWGRVVNYSSVREITHDLNKTYWSKFRFVIPIDDLDS